MIVNKIPAGTYIVAVSGGIDSICLLHMLVQQDDLDLIVAHVDHSIRSESAKDADFVQTLAENYGCKYESTTLQLSQHASEDTARQQRYAFLRQAMHDHKAQAIIAAHHADDQIETSILNLLRGADRYGAAATMEQPDILRPLLGVTKDQLVAYAQEQGLEWREDQTNVDLRYRRNEIRRGLVPLAELANPDFREQYLTDITELNQLNQQLDTEFAKLVHIANNQATIELVDLQNFDLATTTQLIGFMIRELGGTIELSSAAVQSMAVRLIRDQRLMPFTLVAGMQAATKNQQFVLTLTD